MKINRKIEILWRPELAHIQELNKMPKYADKSKAFVRKKISERIDPEILRTQICDELFERDYTLIRKQIAEETEQVKSPVVFLCNSFRTVLHQLRNHQMW